jgi:hypothetical protein
MASSMIDSMYTKEIEKYGNKYTSHLSSNFAPLLSAVYAIENRGTIDPKTAVSTKGASGYFQIMPKTFLGVKKLLPEKWGTLSYDTVKTSPLLSREFSGDLMRLNRQEQLNRGITPTDETLVMQHNISGKGLAEGLKTGNLPKETKNYLRFYKNYRDRGNVWQET